MTKTAKLGVPGADDLIAFQGRPGAYSNLACRGAFPEMQTLPCDSFEDMFAAVRDGKAGWPWCRSKIPLPGASPISIT